MPFYNFLRLWVFLPFIMVSFPALGDEVILRLGIVLEPPHLDPTAGAAAAIDEIGYANIFEGLTKIDRDGKIQPLLARKWKISADGLVWRFHLKKNVRFHDGTDFNADDAIFSLERARDPKGVNAQKKLFESIESITKTEMHQLVIKLKWPDASLLYYLGWGDAVMVAPESASNNKIKPIGTGPFRFERWNSASHIVLENYPDYHGKRPQLDKVVFRFISDPATARIALQTGQVDAFPNFPAPESVYLFKDDPNFNIVIGSTEGETILVLNHAHAILKNKKVREAIAHAINKQDIIDGAMFGYGERIGSHFPPFHPAYVDLKDFRPYNLQKARDLLKEAGFEKGLSLTLSLPPPAYARRSGEIIAAQLKKIDINVNILPLEWPVWLERVFQNSDYDMSIVAHTEPDDINIYARQPYYFNYNNQDFNNVVSELQKVTRPAKRKRLYARAQEILAEDQANVFLFQLPKIGIWSKNILGLWENSPIQANDVTEVVVADK